MPNTRLADYLDYITDNYECVSIFGSVRFACLLPALAAGRAETDITPRMADVFVHLWRPHCCWGGCVTQELRACDCTSGLDGFPTLSFELMIVSLVDSIVLCGGTCCDHCMASCVFACVHTAPNQLDNPNPETIGVLGHGELF